MHKRSSREANEIAAQFVQDATEFIHDGKNPAAVLLGRMGGLKGGAARAKSLSAKKRSAIARKAAKARWQKNAKSQ